MANINLEVIQPTQIKVKGEYDHIIVPGIDGDFGISEGHTTFITKIRPGILQLHTGKQIENYAIHDGFVTVEEDKIIIITDIIERESEIDKARAEQAKKRAENRLKSNQEDINFRRAEFALKKALVRLSL